MRGLLVHAGEEEGGMIEVLVLVTLTRRRPIVSIGRKGGGGLFVHAGEKRVDNKYLEAVATDHPHCGAWSRLQETNRTTFAPLTPREYQAIF